MEDFLRKLLDTIFGNIFWVFFAVIIINNIVRKKRAQQRQDPNGASMLPANPLAQFIKIIAAIQEKSQIPKISLAQMPLAQKMAGQNLFLPITQHAKPVLERRKKYLQIALNSTLDEAKRIISQLPTLERIIIEAGTPLIKTYGVEAISEIKNYILTTHFQQPYIVADIKCADLAQREVQMVARAGASAATCLGVAPVATINAFIKECKNSGINSMVDMMNVESPILVLKQLENPPDVVMVHRGVDETETDAGKLIPYYQINQIKGNCDVLVAIAGGDNVKEIESAVFNGANIVVLWKAFYKLEGNISSLIKEFLNKVR